MCGAHGIGSGILSEVKTPNSTRTLGSELLGQAAQEPAVHPPGDSQEARVPEPQVSGWLSGSVRKMTSFLGVWDSPLWALLGVRAPDLLSLLFGVGEPSVHAVVRGSPNNVGPVQSQVRVWLCFTLSVRQLRFS